MAKTVLSQTKKVKYSVRPDGTQEYTRKSQTRVSQETGNGLKDILAKVPSPIKKVTGALLIVVLEEIVRALIGAWLKSKFNF